MKSVWSGSLSFGLVTIALKLYSAIAPHSPGFTMLCAKCQEPIVYERWCKHCNKQVAWTNVVKGLMQPDGSYFILTQENLKKLRPEKTDYITIQEFVDRSQIQWIYIDAHYLGAPSKDNEKEFFLFQSALEKSNRVAIGTFVMHDKEHVAAITAYKNGLLINTLNYAYEIKDLGEIPRLDKTVKLSAAELKLANQLIDSLTIKKFDLSKYKDTFKHRLEKAIKAQKKSKRAAKATKKTKTHPVKAEKLMAALQASLKKHKGTRQPVARAKSRR